MSSRSASVDIGAGYADAYVHGCPDVGATFSSEGAPLVRVASYIKGDLRGYPQVYVHTMVFRKSNKRTKFSGTRGRVSAATAIQRAARSAKTRTHCDTCDTFFVISPVTR